MIYKTNTLGLEPMQDSCFVMFFMSNNGVTASHAIGFCCTHHESRRACCHHRQSRRKLGTGQQFVIYLFPGEKAGHCSQHALLARIREFIGEASDRFYNAPVPLYMQIYFLRFAISGFWTFLNHQFKLRCFFLSPDFTPRVPKNFYRTSYNQTLV